MKSVDSLVEEYRKARKRAERDGLLNEILSHPGLPTNQTYVFEQLLSRAEIYVPGSLDRQNLMNFCEKLDYKVPESCKHKVFQTLFLQFIHDEIVPNEVVLDHMSKHDPSKVLTAYGTLKEESPDALKNCLLEKTKEILSDPTRSCAVSQYHQIDFFAKHPELCTEEVKGNLLKSMARHDKTNLFKNIPGTLKMWLNTVGSDLSMICIDNLIGYTKLDELADEDKQILFGEVRKRLIGCDVHTAVHIGMLLPEFREEARKRIKTIFNPNPDELISMAFEGKLHHTELSDKLKKIYSKNENWPRDGSSLKRMHQMHMMRQMGYPLHQIGYPPFYGDYLNDD